MVLTINFQIYFLIDRCQCSSLAFSPLYSIWYMYSTWCVFVSPTARGLRIIYYYWIWICLLVFTSQPFIFYTYSFISSFSPFLFSSSFLPPSPLAPSVPPSPPSLAWPRWWLSQSPSQHFTTSWVLPVQRNGEPPVQCPLVWDGDIGLIPWVWSDANEGTPTEEGQAQVDKVSLPYKE